MAFNSTLPPQAYTRDILAAAYTWLQKQPESIRKLATSPDSLAGLYLRAQRYGAVNPEAEAPVSSQNFMSELKNLATDLRQFEKPQEIPNGAAAMHYDPPAAPLAHSHHTPHHHQQFTAQPPAGFNPQPAHQPASQVTHQPPTRAHAPTTSTQTPPSGGLTPRSREMLAEIRDALNLSSDSEAVNLAIGVAYKNLKSLLT